MAIRRMRARFNWWTKPKVLAAFRRLHQSIQSRPAVITQNCSVCLALMSETTLPYDHQKDKNGRFDCWSQTPLWIFGEVAKNDGYCRPYIELSASEQKCPCNSLDTLLGYLTPTYEQLDSKTAMAWRETHDQNSQAPWNGVKIWKAKELNFSLKVARELGVRLTTEFLMVDIWYGLGPWAAER